MAEIKFKLGREREGLGSSVPFFKSSKRARCLDGLILALYPGMGTGRTSYSASMECGSHHF